MPIIDMELYLSTVTNCSPSQAALDECKKVAECFHRYGIIIIRDPRVNMDDNDEYINLMEVGATPEYIEKAREHGERLDALRLADEDMPISPRVPVMDAKWRYMWKIGQRPEGASDDFP